MFCKSGEKLLEILILLSTRGFVYFLQRELNRERFQIIHKISRPLKAKACCQLTIVMIDVVRSIGQFTFDGIRMKGLHNTGLAHRRLRSHLSKCAVCG